MRTAADSLLAVFFPSECRLCSTPLTEISRVPVCSACIARVKPIQGILCEVCGETLPLQNAESPVKLCSECREERPRFEKAVAFGSYDGALRDLIHLLKYEHVMPVANHLGRALASALQVLAPADDQKSLVLVPVPLHKSRLRQRGFNQSEQIARAAVRYLPDPRAFQLAPLALRRVRATDPQTGLTDDQRRTNVRSAFTVVRPEQIAGRDVVLIDDIMTTGTTAAECARVLLKGGAARVRVATVARVLKFTVENQWKEQEISAELRRRAASA